MDSPAKTDFSKGANNIATADRLPDGFYRQAINLDPLSGGKLELRCGFESVYAGTSVRAVFSVGGQVVFVDGSQLRSFDTNSNTTNYLGDVGLGYPLAGAVLNNQLFFSSPTQTYRLQGSSLKPWAVPAPNFNIAIGQGNLPAGTYKVAVTSIDADGAESGVIPAVVTLSGKESIQVYASGGNLRCYCSAVNSAELYEQGTFSGNMTINSPDDDGAVLSTAFMMSMPSCNWLVAYHGVLAGAVGNVLWVTEPMRPHLVDPERGFFQYPKQIDLLASTDAGIYVATSDQTFFLTGVETDTPQQVKVADFGAVPGASCSLPDGTCAWFTQYGQVIGDSAGQLRLQNKGTYAPDTAAQGASGLLEHNGSQRIVTTMRGTTKSNRLAASDFVELEITDER